ncbi:Zn-ribbon domain-containing OB-fold protein [Prescottella sp. R16]|uniref:Zn-ribbon domain-containing OB-fold protein n=1 Tax=Prescottella sp. R16 TaxID=3064529 RepID=UPI00272E8EBB|nr:zinc ribbon domain-containing protein [Prescottella sp. R16]
MHPSFDTAALRCDDAGVTLLGARCTRCDTVSFPSRDRCANCYAPADLVDLTGNGTVVSHSTAMFPIAGMQPPVHIAQVRLADSGIEILGVSADGVRIGDEVAVVPRVVGSDDNLFTTYGFGKEDSDA